MVARSARQRRVRRNADQVWRQIIEEWYSSGLSQEDFCEKERYSIEAFKWFYQKLYVKVSDVSEAETLSDTDTSGRLASSNIAIAPLQKNLTESRSSTSKPIRSIAPHKAPAKADASLEIVLATGITLRIASSCSSQLLRSVVLILEGDCHV